MRLVVDTAQSAVVHVAVHAIQRNEPKIDDGLV
jgi:hypothetical protein